MAVSGHRRLLFLTSIMVCQKLCNVAEKASCCTHSHSFIRMWDIAYVCKQYGLSDVTVRSVWTIVYGIISIFNCKLCTLTMLELLHWTFTRKTSSLSAHLVSHTAKPDVMLHANYRHTTEITCIATETHKNVLKPHSSPLCKLSYHAPQALQLSLVTIHLANHVSLCRDSEPWSNIGCTLWQPHKRYGGSEDTFWRYCCYTWTYTVGGQVLYLNLRLYWCLKCTHHSSCTCMIMHVKFSCVIAFWIPITVFGLCHNICTLLKSCSTCFNITDSSRIRRIWWGGWMVWGSVGYLETT